MKDHSDQTKDQIKQMIVDIAKKQKPQTTNELIQAIHQKTALRTQKINELLIELENEEKIQFTKKLPLPVTSAAYFLSKQTSWYWVTIVISIVAVITVFAVPTSAFPLVCLRIAVGLVFILFLPGYAFIKTLYPSQVPIRTNSETLDTIERLALSIGLNLALIPITALILNYTPWGIRLVPITLSLLVITVCFATAALLREYRAK